MSITKLTTLLTMVLWVLDIAELIAKTGEIEVYGAFLTKRLIIKS